MVASTLCDVGELRGDPSSHCEITARRPSFLFKKGSNMKRPDGFGYSPDSGRFEIKNNTIYWEDGDITENADTAFFRSMPAEAGELYSEWTDDYRAAVKAEYAANRATVQQDLQQQDNKTYQLDSEAIELIIEALGTYVAPMRERSLANCGMIAYEADRLIEYLKSGGEAP